MTSRLARALVLMLLAAGSALLPSAALAEDVPDTTAPQVRLNPCYDATSCRRVHAQVFGDLEPGDDLAVLGARIGDRVLEEHVYDDGTGFQPHGLFGPYGNDVFFQVDYALSIEVPRGTSEITFYARDLAGNTSELTTTVHGPIAPGPVGHLEARLRGPRTAVVSWRRPNLHSSCCVRYVVTTPGRPAKSFSSLPPSFLPTRVSFARLSVGWHRFTVRPSTTGGVGPARTVRVFVPRRQQR